MNPADSGDRKMKIVYKAEELMWGVLDCPEAQEELLEDSSKARQWLEGEAFGLQEEVHQRLDSPDYDPDMIVNIEGEEPSYYTEDGEGEVWEYRGKRSESVDAFLPALEAKLLRELDADTRKQITMRISEKTLDDAYDALADITHELSEAQCLRAIVESLTFSDWEVLVTNHERQIRRAVANTQRESKWKKK